MRILDKTHIRLESSVPAFAMRLLVPLLCLLVASCSGGDEPDPPAPSLGNDASLSSVSISGATLDPVFSSSVTEYTTSIAAGTTSVDVVASTSDENARLTINGGVPTNVDLMVGENTIVILVTAEDGTTTRTYTIVITRPASSNANLSGLELTDIILVPPFDTNNFDYSATEDFLTTSTEVTATAEDVNATVSVNGTAVSSGVAGEPIPLDEGANTITVRVTAESTATKTYTVVVNRQSALGIAQTAYVKASGADEWRTVFGGSVALSGDGTTLAVGAWGDASVGTGVNGVPGDNAADVSGAVFVFTRDSAGTWSQQAYVKASNTGSEDYFGYSIALSEDGATLAVGAFGEDSVATGVNGDETDNSAENAGAAYVFTRDSAGTWSQQAYVKASNTDTKTFGDAVGLSWDGATLAVGAAYQDESSGAVYVFTRDNASTWSQQGYLKASNTDSWDVFGRSVSLSGDGLTLAVGAIGEDSVATGVDGDETDNSAEYAGAVYVFTRDSAGTWSQRAYVKASNTDRKDEFGFSVSLSGDGAMLAVGADEEDSVATGVDGDETDNSAPLSGAAYIFERGDTGTWIQRAYIKASNADGGWVYDQEDQEDGVFCEQNDESCCWREDVVCYEQGDRFGGAVSLSGNGETLAVGARIEASNARGVNGNETDNSLPGVGAVYVFELSKTPEP